MTGLIIELQKDASDSSVPVETLLRRMKLAAAKLLLPDLEKWVESELNGYCDEPPAYRIVLGSPTAWNPYNGWIPIHASSPELMESFSTAHIRQTVGSIEDLLSNHTEGPLFLPMNSRTVDVINSMSDYQAPRMSYKLQRGILVTIISRVRNMVLDWAIEMERSGVVGEGFTFSSSEKTQARETMTNIHIGTFTGILGSNNSSGSINSGVIHKQQFEDELAKLAKSVDALVQDGADPKKLPAAVKALEKELSRREPRESKLRGFLNDTNQALVGASGSLIADGAKLAISNLLSVLG